MLISTHSNLDEREIIEILFYFTQPQENIFQLTNQVFDKFGTLKGLLQSRDEDILSIQGVSTHFLMLIKVIKSVGIHLNTKHLAERPSLNTLEAVAELFRLSTPEPQKESLNLLYLDTQNCLIFHDVQDHGTVNHITLYPRNVMKKALEVGASSLIIVHNHPSGDPTPSIEDIRMTETLIKAGAIFGIKIHDHIVIGEGRSFSMSAMGLI